MKHVLVTLILVASSGTLLAQRPDFSGDRTLNLSASRLSAAQAAVQSGRLRIEHHDPIVHVRLTLVTVARPSETDTERTTDGREVRVQQTTGTVVSSARWEGEALVFLTRVEGTELLGFDSRPLRS